MRADSVTVKWIKQCWNASPQEEIGFLIPSVQGNKKQMISVLLLHTTGSHCVCLTRGDVLFKHVYLCISHSTISFELFNEPKDQHLLKSMYGFLCGTEAVPQRTPNTPSSISEQRMKERLRKGLHSEHHWWALSSAVWLFSRTL
jgi:hypothetical protein